MTVSVQPPEPEPVKVRGCVIVSTVGVGVGATVVGAPRHELEVPLITSVHATVCPSVVQVTTVVDGVALAAGLADELVEVMVLSFKLNGN